LPSPICIFHQAGFFQRPANLTSPGDYIDKGIAEAQSAIHIDGSLPSAYSALGSGYSMKGMEAQSRQAFLRALKLNPIDRMEGRRRAARPRPGAACSKSMACWRRRSRPRSLLC
jgi:hypothetical protein